MTILFDRRKRRPAAPDPIDILRNGWRDDLTDDEVIELQCEYFQAALPDPESVLWTINNLHPIGRKAYAHGVRQRIASGTYFPVRDSSFGKV